MSPGVISLGLIVVSLPAVWYLGTALLNLLTKLRNDGQVLVSFLKEATEPGLSWQNHLMALLLRIYRKSLHMMASLDSFGIKCAKFHRHDGIYDCLSEGLNALVGGAPKSGHGSIAFGGTADGWQWSVEDGGCIELPSQLLILCHQLGDPPVDHHLVKASFVPVMAAVVVVLSTSVISAIGLTVTPNCRGDERGRFPDIFIP
ncbi:hypothetical protein TIFTF001_025335 [Ficus carica]|uniref:Uncharacterized protein n=1 Tax=Ficus carica TaxID=3494 RepID=A0AA88AJM9_FICCA|nr:hypothetical protein TIFTF001_025335 [Ficus carica]